MDNDKTDNYFRGKIIFNKGKMSLTERIIVNYTLHNYPLCISFALLYAGIQKHR